MIKKGGFMRLAYIFSSCDFYKLRVFFLKRSQTDLAKDLKCSLPLINLIESGNRKITPELSQRLVDLVKKHCGYDPKKDGSEYDFLSRCLKEIE